MTFTKQTCFWDFFVQSISKSPDNYIILGITGDPRTTYEGPPSASHKHLESTVWWKYTPWKRRQQVCRLVPENTPLKINMSLKKGLFQ